MLRILSRLCVGGLMVVLQSAAASAAQIANVHINEFVSENLSRANDPTAPADMDGDYPDWIELKNNEAVSVNLSGYALSDDPAQLAKWAFPATSIAARGYLVVYASGKNRSISSVQPHTNFKLSSPGQIILSRTNDVGGWVIVHSIIYSDQRQGVSYGTEGNTNTGALKYFTTPTPGVTNNDSTAVTNFVTDTRFDVDRGFYSAPFTVNITCSTPGAIIAYTINGSAPSLSNGIQVPAADSLTAPTASVAVARTTLLRARAWKTGLGPSDIDTQSYLFLDEVMTQNAPPASMNLTPADTLAWGATGGDLANLSAFPGLTFYGVNQAIASDADPANRFAVDDLKQVPVVSVVMDWRQLFGTNITTSPADGGIYPPASGVANEGVDRAASFELLNPNGDPINPNAAQGFQTDGNIHIFGGTSQIRWKSYKLSFRFQCSRNVNYRVYGDSGADRFDNFILDARINNTWMHPTDNNQRNRADYVNDQVMADLQTAMSGRGGFRNRPVHLFLNGLYWGLYSLHEKPDHHFAESYYGGDSDDWDVFKHSVHPSFNESDPLVNTRPSNPTNAISRSNATVIDNYERMLDRVGVGYVAPNPTPDLTVLANYEAVAELLDLDDFIDYMIVNFLAGNWDWSDKNLYAMYYRPGGGKWRFHSWDAEHTFRTGSENYLTGTGNEVPRLGQPKGIHNKLKANAEYRLKFADHLRRHLFNNGVLSVAGMSNAFAFRFSEIDEPIRGESARWGHIRASVRSPSANVPYKRSDWLTRVNSLLVSESGTGPSLIQNRWNLLMAPSPAAGSFRTENLYPSVDAPDFSHYGGPVPTGFSLVLTRPGATGTLYFTTDASDPRVCGTGAVAPSAQAYSVPIVLNAPTLVRARVLSGTNWSAMTEAMFHPPQDLSKLVISEIMYNPPAMGSVAGDEFEFIELKNTGTNTLNLSGLAFTSGITFLFTNGTLLAPGQFFVLVRNPAQFAAKYPGVTINGVYNGKLDNGGETLRLSHTVLATTALSATYNDRHPWPVAADNFGFSLVLRDPASHPDLDSGVNWRASAQPGGSPGADDPTPDFPPIVVNEVLTASEWPTVDAVELFNPGAGDANVGGWFLTDDPDTPRKFRIPAGIVISPGTYLVFTEADFNPTPGTNNSFSLSSQGDQIYLLSGDANTNLTGYSHGFSFGAAAPGVTLGRYLISTGEEQFPPQSACTLGTNNAGPLVGPVVINEIHYHPDAGDEEFIELRNITPDPVRLFDPDFPTNAWRLNGLGYTFPTNITMGSNELLLLVATNPALFRAKYNVPEAVQIFGPWFGVLQDSGERLELQRPGTPDTNGVPYITVEEVRYNDKAPWPPAADGSGPSLQRKLASAYGNDPINWVAALPTPGQPYAGGTPPTIVVPPTNQTVIAYRPASFMVVAEGPEPMNYQWRFEGNDLAGATNAILLLTNVQPSQAGAYSVLVFNAAGSTVSSNAMLAILFPPNITLHPRSTNVFLGSNVTLTVAATGSFPLTCQWFKNDEPIPGATNLTFTMTSVQMTNEGFYRSVITDAIASEPSQAAYVKVIFKPAMVEHPSPLTNVVLQGRSATFKIVASGSLPLSFRWRRGSSTLTNIILETNVCFFTLSNVQPASSSNINVVVTNLAGSIPVSSNAYLYILLPLEDADGDHMSNADEFVAGTDPRDPASVLKIGRLETVAAATCVIEFRAVSNRTYRVDFSGGLTPPTWGAAATLEAGPTSRLVRWTNTPPAGAGFYRLRVE